MLGVISVVVKYQKNVKHNRTGTVHGVAGDRLLCGNRIKGHNMHDPHVDTTDKELTCKNCKRASTMYSFWHNLR